MNDTRPVDIVGIGLMGEVFSRRLIDAGFSVIGYDLDPARRARLDEIGGKSVAGIADLAQPARCILISVFSTDQVEDVVEKPTPTEAEQRLLVPGLRAGHYLCLFGMHVVTPGIMEILDRMVSQVGERGKVNFAAALAELAARERCLALEVQGWRYDVGVKYGLLTAQMALALTGKDRDEVLAKLLELLALREMQNAKQ